MKLEQMLYFINNQLYTDRQMLHNALILIFDFYTCIYLRYFYNVYMNGFLSEITNSSPAITPHVLVIFKQYKLVLYRPINNNIKINILFINIRHFTKFAL